MLDHNIEPLIKTRNSDLLSLNSNILQFDVDKDTFEEIRFNCKILLKLQDTFEIWFFINERKTSKKTLR